MDFHKGNNTILDYGRNSIAVFGNIIYPMNPRYSKEPERGVLGQREKNIILQREMELSKLIKTDHLDTEQLKALGKVRRDYNDVFQLENDPLQFTSVVKHVIIAVPGTTPINFRPYRVAEGQRK